MTLLIGPLPPPITGQSISFSYLTKLTPKERFRIYNYNKSSFNFFNYLDSLFFLPIFIFFNKIDTIYFLGSRSRIGFIRQLPFLTFAILKRIKLINHLHGADFKDFYKESKLLKHLIKWAYQNIDTSIVLLEQMKDQFQAFPKMKLLVVPNAISKELQNLKIEFPKEKRILFLSNIMASKGIIEFLTASNQLLKDDKSLRIDIAGDFIKDNYLTKNQIKKKFFDLFNRLKRDFPERVFYHGIVLGSTKSNLLASSSIFILPTYYPTEAYPISIIEAMATGNAIITTKHNYLDKIISKENGKIIQPKSNEEIICAIKDLFLNEDKLRLIQNFNLNKSKNYSLEKHIKSIKSII